MLPVLVLLCIFAIVNLTTVMAFAADKRAAIEGRRRIRESDLLTLALIGGSPGALWARSRYRHKTRKQPFSLNLHLIVMVQAGVAWGCWRPSFKRRAIDALATLPPQD